MTNKTWTRGMFALGDGAACEGYSRGETWNGFACPVLTRAGCETLASEGAGVTFDGEVLTFPYEDEREIFTSRTIVVDGTPLRVWDCGAGAYCWAYVNEECLALMVPALLYSHEALVLHVVDGERTTSEGASDLKAWAKVRPDLERLAGLLVPADDHEAWVVAEVAERRSFDNRLDEVLVELLTSGVITRAQVAAAIDAVEAADDAERERRAPCTGRACE